MTTTEKLFAIANENKINPLSINGKIDLLREVLSHQDKKVAKDFMLDTLIMLGDDEVDKAYKGQFDEV